MLVKPDKKSNLFSEVGIILRNAVTMAAAGLALCLVLSSCDQLLSVNLLKTVGLGQQQTPSASELASMPVSAMSDLSSSPSFYSDLAGDASLRAAALASLDSQMLSPDAATRQDAAALAALIELKTTPAFDAVNGIFNALDSLSTTNLSSLDSTTIVDFVSQSLPASATASQADFAATIGALCAANAAYDSLGASLGASGAAGSILPEQSVQGAIVAAFVSSVPGATPDAKASALWAAMNGGPGLPPYTPPSTSSGTNLGSIISAAGLDLSKYGI